MATPRRIKSPPVPRIIGRILARLEKAHPDAKLDLDFKNPLELLIALILAAQARDDLVNKVTAELFKTYRTAADYAAAPPRNLE
jgi:endonuclease-3